MILPPYFFVFDVESIGLHGEGFAVGYVVLDQAGKLEEEAIIFCDPDTADGPSSSRDWVSGHVPNSYALANHDSIALVQESPRDVRAAFWKIWLKWKLLGAIMFADCLWPVEARFLINCVDDEQDAREWQGPYPFHDIATVLWAKGKDPMAKNKRLPNELPEHDPLCDARQSARLLMEAIQSDPAKP